MTTDSNLQLSSGHRLGRPGFCEYAQLSQGARSL